MQSFGVRVDSWRDRNSNLYYSLKLEKFVVGTIIGIEHFDWPVFLGDGDGALVTQKRRDIGLMMALGFEPMLLRRVFGSCRRDFIRQSEFLLVLPLVFLQVF